MIRALLIAAGIGWVDQLINQAVWKKPRGWRPKWYLWGHFWSIHIAFGVLFLIASFPRVHYILLMIVVEDISYWLWHPYESLSEKGATAWINWPFQDTKWAGFYLFPQMGAQTVEGIEVPGGIWIPTTYLLLSGIFVLVQLFIS